MLYADKAWLIPTYGDEHHIVGCQRALPSILVQQQLTFLHYVLRVDVHSLHGVVRVLSCYL